MLYCGASSQRWALLAACCPMPAIPLVRAPTKPSTAEAAMKAANANTTAKRAMPLASLFGAWNYLLFARLGFYLFNRKKSLHE
jgi:hypothetical protein